MEEEAGLADFRGATTFSMVLDRQGRPHLAYSRYAVSASHYGSFVYAVRENGSWREQRVTVGKLTSGHSLVLDAQERPHLTYFTSTTDRTDAQLRYSHWDGSTWHHEMIESAIDPLAYFWGTTSLALDIEGNPHIAYDNLAGLGVRYAYFDGSNWGRQDVTEDEGTPALGLDAAGNPLVVHFDGDELKATRWGAGRWTMERIDQASGASKGSLALDGTGQPHITYQEAEESMLTYASYDGQAWVREPIESVGDLSYTPLVLDAQARPHLVYTGYIGEAPTTKQLIYAYRDGSGWHQEALGTASCYTAHRGADIALDSAGRLHIAYCDAAALNYAVFDGSRWNSQVVAEAGAVAGMVSLALDSAGQPHISYAAYFDALQPLGVRYIHREGTTWLVEDFAPDIEVGGSSATAIVLDADDLPHIAYEGGYAHWDGSAWHIAALGGENTPVLAPSLVLDSQSRPYIGHGSAGLYSYWDGQHWTLKQVGTSVGAMELLLDGDDNPHVVYEEWGDVKYAHLTESNQNEPPFTLYMPVVRR